MNALRALWAPRTWRATAHALAGLVLGLLVASVLVTLLVLWWAALFSLLAGPTGTWALVTVYVLWTFGAPVPLLWFIRAAGRLQRARFRWLLGVDLPRPLPVEGSGLRRLVREWRSPATGRQLTYHVVALFIGVVGGGVLLACWSAVPVAVGFVAGDWNDDWYPGFGVTVTALAPALLFGAPWVARGLAHVDTLAARELLGRSRADELAEQVAALARSRAEIVAATDAERRRIERDLHDGAQQRLVSLAMNLGMARAALDRDGASLDRAREAVREAHDEAKLALTELREFVRGLHAAVLNDRGLDAALSGIAARAPFPVRLRVDVDERCPPSVEAIAYFIVSEALTNVAKHAGARHADVSVERTGTILRIVVTDDGNGGADPERGTGLRGLARRAASVDGTLDVRSPPGGPTTVTAELPCTPEEP
ncbi:sensor histidine kinase [Virgisporangium aliadipatigenens]|nr:sensor histidine kinase [Virgisporangium aliadipatigenens]